MNIYLVASLEKAFSLASIAGSLPFTGIFCSHRRQLSQPCPAQAQWVQGLTTALQKLISP